MILPNSSFATVVALVLAGLGVQASSSLGGDPAAAGSVQDFPVGEVRTLAGPIDAGSGGLEVDGDGNVYTADFGATLSQGPPGTRVWRITPGGEVSVFAEGLRGASGNTIDGEGRFFQSNIAANTVSMIAPDGTLTPHVTDGLTNPVGIVFAGEDLMVANCGGHNVLRVTPDGDVSVFASGSVFRCPNGIVLDDAGNLYTSNFGNGDVVRITPSGEASVFATVPGGNNGHLVYHEGVFFVAARSAHQIYELNMEGELHLIAGSGEHGVDDGPAMEATLSYPNDLGVSPDGRILYWNDVAAIVEDRGQTLAPTVVRMIRIR